MRGRAARAARNLVRALLGKREADDARASADDALQFRHGVEVEADRNAEPVAQRGRQQAGARRGPNQSEGRKVYLDRARRRPRADDEIELEILHRRIKDFLHGGIEAVDLVDEQHVARLQVGELRGKVAGLGDHRP